MNSWVWLTINFVLMWEQLPKVPPKMNIFFHTPFKSWNELDQTKSLVQKFFFLWTCVKKFSWMDKKNLDGWLKKIVAALAALAVGDPGSNPNKLTFLKTRKANFSSLTSKWAFRNHLFRVEISNNMKNTALTFGYCICVNRKEINVN